MTASAEAGTRPMTLSYAAITPARDERANLERLAAAISRQSVLPVAWIVVDNGSTDGTTELIDGLSAEHPWISACHVPGTVEATPGAPIVRAFHAGLETLRAPVDVVVKLDADLSFDPDYFEILLAAFAADPRLGIASGSCWEEEDGEWVERRVSRDHVRGASRAYRWECLQAVLPLEEGMGWDGVDALKAKARGWTTRIVPEARFRHHRAVGARDGAPHRRWLAQGRGAHYMGYRPSYLVLRTLNSMRRDPRAIAMLWAYASSLARRAPRCADPEARALLRDEQRLRNLRRREHAVSERG